MAREPKLAYLTYNEKSSASGQPRYSPGICQTETLQERAPCRQLKERSTIRG